MAGGAETAGHDRAIVALWLIASAYVQWTHAASFIHEYSKLLPLESFGALEWPLVLQDVAYSRWRLLPQTWGALGFDVAWWRARSTGGLWELPWLAWPLAAW